MYGKSKLDVDFVVEETEEEPLKLSGAVGNTEDRKADFSSKQPSDNETITLEMVNALPKEEKKALLKRLKKLLKKSKWRKKFKIAQELYSI